MQNLNKFQDGGFIRKEVFSDAREERAAVRETEESMAIYMKKAYGDFCLPCYRKGVGCSCDGMKFNKFKESTDDQKTSL